MNMKSNIFDRLPECSAPSVLDSWPSLMESEPSFKASSVPSSLSSTSWSHASPADVVAVGEGHAVDGTQQVRYNSQGRDNEHDLLKETWAPSPTININQLWWRAFEPDLISTRNARSGGSGVKDRESNSICRIVSDTRLIATAWSLV